MLLTVPKRTGHAIPGRATWGSTGVSQEPEGVMGKRWARLFTMIFRGGNEQDVVSSLSRFRKNNKRYKPT